MKSSYRFLLAVILGLSGFAAAATECGVGNTALVFPFAGHWRNQAGDTYDIAPGAISRTFTVPLSNGSEKRGSAYHFATATSDETPDISVLDCRNLTHTERDSIEQEMVQLADAASAPDSDLRKQYGQMIAKFRAHLTHPPYPMLAFTHYEDEQWLILLSPDRLLDIWYGEGDFSVDLYERMASKKS